MLANSNALVRLTAAAGPALRNLWVIVTSTPFSLQVNSSSNIAVIVFCLKSESIPVAFRELKRIVRILPQRADSAHYTFCYESVLAACSVVGYRYHINNKCHNIKPV